MEEDSRPQPPEQRGHQPNLQYVHLCFEGSQHGASWLVSCGILGTETYSQEIWIRFHPLLALWPWENRLTSLSSGFFIHNDSIVLEEVLWRLKEIVSMELFYNLQSPVLLPNETVFTGFVPLPETWGGFFPNGLSCKHSDHLHFQH